MTSRSVTANFQVFGVAVKAPPADPGGRFLAIPFLLASFWIDWSDHLLESAHNVPLRNICGVLLYDLRSRRRGGGGG
jgi:hypothetical protein